MIISWRLGDWIGIHYKDRKLSVQKCLLKWQDCLYLYHGVHKYQCHLISVMEMIRSSYLLWLSLMEFRSQWQNCLGFIFKWPLQYNQYKEPVPSLGEIRSQDHNLILYEDPCCLTSIMTIKKSWDNLIAMLQLNVTLFFADPAIPTAATPVTIATATITPATRATVGEGPHLACVASATWGILASWTPLYR